jgi:amino acid adenylation domain-containing protein
MKAKAKAKTLQEQLNRTFKQFKDKTAIEYGNHALTYGELDRRTDAIAAWIVKRGFNKTLPTGKHVGILLADKIEFIAVMLAILKAGGIFVPLDPANPAERLERMIAIADVSTIVTDIGSLERYLKSAAVQLSTLQEQHRFLFMEEIQTHLNTRAADLDRLPLDRRDPEDNIYIYFTSGTTGFPRAVLGKNKSLLHFPLWERDTFHLDESFRFSQVASPGFDAFLKELFLSLLCGATLCIPAARETVFHPDRLIRYVEKYKINLFHCVPAIFRLLNSINATRKSFPQLKYVLVSGDTLYPKDLANWYLKFKERIQLVNLYGTTETTILKSYYFIRQADMHRERIPVGQPVADAEILILDENLEPCPPGAVGDVYIKTPYRTSGYYKEPELTRAKFIANPLSPDPEDLLYKTGDLGTFLPDGNIDLLGRKDRQVKIRGNRLELGEIEAVLMKHPRVKEAVVIKIGESIHNERLLGYVTTTSAETGETDNDSFTTALKEYLSEKLPDYMVPAHLVKIEQMPGKPNGKVDYEALAAQFKRNDLYSDCPAPKNTVEQKLLEFWIEIIGSGDIGTTYNFFDLGGNSINVMSLISRVQGEFDIRIPIREVFRNPTIEKMAEFISRQKSRPVL